MLRLTTPRHHPLPSLRFPNPLTRPHRLPSVSPTTLNHPQRRRLHDGNIYGYQSPRTFDSPSDKVPDFTPEELENRVRNANLVRLVDSYRRHGHRASSLDPLQLSPRKPIPALDPRRYGFPIPPSLSPTWPRELTSSVLPPDPTAVAEDERWDLKGILHLGDSRPSARLDEILSHLSSIYSSGLGFEFMHLHSKPEREWIARLLESSYVPEYDPTSQRSPSGIGAEGVAGGGGLEDGERLRYWKLLVSSEVFDQWLGKKFPNVKRYSLEGAESMIVALERIFRSSTVNHGIEQVVLAMPHRGRLNVLTQLLGFDMRLLIRKMRGQSEIPTHLLSRGLSGDVLSHLVCSPILTYDDPSTTTSTSPSSSKQVRIHLLPNPSHLEAINPVALGFARALQLPGIHRPPTTTTTSLSSEEQFELGDKVMSVQVHGDAAFGGQGVVAESLNLVGLPHFNVGGTIRLVVNNQLGYTTASIQGRSSFYATDLAKSIAAPVIHVNGDKVEDVARAVDIAVAYRNQFRKDVVIDLVTYRRWGHNELDEPSFTSPVMYRKIASLESVPQIYEKNLLSRSILSPSTASSFKSSLQETFDTSLAETDKGYEPPEPEMKHEWTNMEWVDKAVVAPDTGVEYDRLKSVGRASVEVPEGFQVHPRLRKMHIQKRLQSLEKGQGIDFSTAEAMAFGSLLMEGYHVRLSGQDSGRGTFSQRHAILADQESERCFIPLNTLPTGARAEIVNSPLSEFSVMGFEQGFSWVTPYVLPMWEAQFGDFYNGAQIILDTFFASAETKWMMQTGLTLLLPHGYDGAGPEHSSAHVERFLQMSNEPVTRTQFNANVHIVQPTTAAQYFHALRRQMIRTYRKPLVVFSPKGLLRLPAASSELSDFLPSTTWQPVFADMDLTPEESKDVTTVVFLSGKLYYDLVKARKERKATGIAFVRLEEISPFPYEQLSSIISTVYPKSNRCIWAQEEPENAGAYTFVLPRLKQILPRSAEVEYVGRGALGCPATGIGEVFKAESRNILDRIFQ